MSSVEPPARVHVQEVVMRDGLQIEPRFLPTEQKIALIDALSDTGVAKIEVTSFVSPKAVPNLADAREVARALRNRFRLGANQDDRGDHVALGNGGTLSIQTPTICRASSSSNRRSLPARTVVETWESPSRK